MRILVFCGTRSAIEKYDTQTDWTVIVHQYSKDQKAKMIADFCNDPYAKYAVDRSMLHGWRAPAGTFVLFDPSWPYAPDSAGSIQAAARVSQHVTER